MNEIQRTQMNDRKIRQKSARKNAHATMSADALTPEQQLALRDPKLAALIAKVGPFTVRPGNLVRPFDALAESIAYQQLSGKAAATIFGRVRALYPRRKWFSPDLVLATPDEKFRTAGLKPLSQIGRAHV